MKIYKTLPCFFLMAALCGCTTQSIEDAKAIEETKSYAYRYEYETDSAGEAVTKIYNEKPTYDENEQVEEYQQGPLSNKTSMMKFIKMNETFEYYDCEFTVKEAVATRNYNYAKEIIDDKYIDEVMKYFKKQIAYDVDGNLKEDDNRTVWIKIHMKYNGNTSKNVNMCSGFVVKKDDGKLYPFGVQLFVDREERFTSSKDNSIAYCMDINPEDEYDMWIGFEAPVVNSWTYYLEGSFGYIFQPTGYTGYLIELDIEDRGYLCMN